jgi:AraC-like DNA-binding protein
LASDNVPRWLWRWVALCLLVSALGDGLIHAGQLMAWNGSRSLLISAMSSVMLLVLGLIGLSPEWRMPAPIPSPAPQAPAVSLQPGAPETSEPNDTDDHANGPLTADPVLLARLEAHMQEARPWLNPDLTLVALARKLGVPAKTLSTAVNLGHGENVARYVNRYRIEHACTLLLAGQPVTTALYDSGFNTKSNFHREFLRLKQMTPTQWQQGVGAQV